MTPAACSDAQCGYLHGRIPAGEPAWAPCKDWWCSRYGTLSRVEEVHTCPWHKEDYEAGHINR